MKRIVILGSTGSIGQNAMSVVAAHPDEFEIVGLSTNQSVEKLEKQIRQFRPRAVAVANPHSAKQLDERLKNTVDLDILVGQDGIVALAEMTEADLILEGMGGSIGLIPTLSAIRAGNDLAFVNKEVLVMGGSLVLEAAKKNNVQLLPVDSEISAVFQCLQTYLKNDQRPCKEEINRLILTASGGPFRDTPISELSHVTLEQALKHPNWNMGKKITIDSATMMNKGLEVIEAKLFFDLDLSQVEVLIHAESIIHSMVEFIDGSILAQLGVADMRVPIQYALTYPKRLPNPAPRLDFSQIQELHFAPPDLSRFPCLKHAYTAAEVGGTLPAVLSMADEVAVDAFLKRQIGFLDIPRVLGQVLNAHVVIHEPSLDDILTSVHWAEITTKEKISHVT